MTWTTPNPSAPSLSKTEERTASPVAGSLPPSLPQIPTRLLQSHLGKYLTGMSSSDQAHPEPSTTEPKAEPIGSPIESSSEPLQSAPTHFGFRKDGIRVAISSDWPAIASWRDEHFARLNTGRPVTNQHDWRSGLWLVADHGQGPLAALSFWEDHSGDMPIRWVTNLFAKPTLTGGRAAEYLGRFIEAMSDSDGMEMRCQTDPENLGFIHHLCKRGYQGVAVELKRMPRKLINPAWGLNAHSDSRESDKPVEGPS